MKQSNLGPKFKTKLKELFLKKATNGSIIGRQITLLCSPFYANPDCLAPSNMARQIFFHPESSRDTLLLIYHDRK